LIAPYFGRQPGDVHRVGPYEVIHLSRKYLGKKVTLNPEEKSRVRQDYGDQEPGICFAPSIEDAFAFMPMESGPGNIGIYKKRKLHVYTPVNNIDLLVPNEGDIEMSGELKSYGPVDVKYIGTIYFGSGGEYAIAPDYEWVDVD